MRHLKAVGLAVAVLVVLGPAPAPAQDGDGWIGRRVITKFGTVLKVGNVVIEDERRQASPSSGERSILRIYHVEKVNGPWLWLVAESRGSSGWVQAERVVPFDQAIDYFTSEINTNPSSQNYVNRGGIWLDKHEYDIAVGDFNEAIRLEPRNEMAYYNRANAWASKGELDKALADYGEAIRLDPNFTSAFVGRGNVWRAKGELDKALADYGEAIRIDPKLALAYHNRGLTWSDKGELDKALADYGEAIRFDPAFALAYFNRAAAELIASRKGAASDARTYLGLRGWRDEHSLYAVLIGHFGDRQMHRDAEARQILDEAASKGDTSAWPYPVIRYLRREIDEKALLDAAGDNDKMTVARAYLGLDLSLSGRPEEALPHLRWVKDHGNRDYIQYALALAEIDRIEGRKAVSTRP